MKYRVSDSQLKLKEYGRNIQSMVEYMKSVEDRDHRTSLAYEIVSIMSNLQPQLKEFPDYKQKLWDHLYIISDFDLDVDSPYPFPEPTELVFKPSKRMDYYNGKPAYRQYGRNVDIMIQEASEMEEGEIKTQFINIIANTMKQFLRNLDRESTPENIIAEQIREISKGKLQVKAEDLVFHKSTPPKYTPRSNGSSYSNGKRGGRKGGRKKK